MISPVIASWVARRLAGPGRAAAQTKRRRHDLTLPVSVKKHSVYTSLGPAVQRRKVLSTPGLVL